MENSLPTNWTEALLSDIVFFQEGPGLRTFQMGESGMPFLNIRTFNDDETLDKSKCKFVKLDQFENKYEHFLLNEGDIVVSSSGTLGKAIVIRKMDLPVMLNTSVIRFRVLSEQIMAQTFLKYFLKSDYFYQQIQEQKTGMAIDNYGPSHLQLMRIVIPPLAEQHRIVAKLDAVMQKVEANKQRLDKIPKLLKRFRQSVLAAAVSGKLTEEWRVKNGVVEQWGEVTLNSLCDQERGISYGVIKLGDTVINGVPCLRTSDVRPLHINTNSVKKISKSISNNYKRTILQGNEVLVNVRGTLGGVAVVPKSMIGWNVSREIAIVPLASNVSARFIAFHIASPECQNWLSEVAKGVAYTGINLEDLRDLPIKLPRSNEQIEIVKKVDQLFSFAETLEARYIKATSMLGKLPQSILAKAFRGELVAQDPKDEPASLLIERVKKTMAKNDNLKGNKGTKRSKSIANVK